MVGHENVGVHRAAKAGGALFQLMEVEEVIAIPLAE
jgi:hypothetical protein